MSAGGGGPIFGYLRKVADHYLAELEQALDVRGCQMMAVEHDQATAAGQLDRALALRSASYVLQGLSHALRYVREGAAKVKGTDA